MAVSGAYLRSHSRRLQWRFVRRVGWRFLVVPLFMAPALAVGWFTIPYRQFVLGAWSATVVWATILLVAILDGGHNVRAGFSAEQQTAGLLKKLQRRGWVVEHNIPRKGRDVDHAVIGPRGAFALETKYTADEWRITERGILKTRLNGNTELMRWPIDCAQRAARDLRSFARAEPGKVTLPVQPVLVLWGPHLHEIPSGSVVVDGVLVVLGGQAKEWLPKLSAHPLAEDEVARARESLRARIENHMPRAA